MVTVESKVDEDVPNVIDWSIPLNSKLFMLS
jgi:hypothetical protein